MTKLKFDMTTRFEVSDSSVSNDKFFAIIRNFSSQGEVLVKGKRNEIRIFEVDGKRINIKAFKKPTLLNKIVYRFFRKSKAKRSFEYANLLLERGIGTPKPIAFIEYFDAVGLTDSYYVSEQLDADLTYRELVEIPDYPDHENILRQFTHFSYKLHKNGIEFKDHSPGNTLIKKMDDGHYEFYLVDLNRMNFHQKMNFDIRMKNLSRLTPKKEMVRVMSEEYAKLSGEKFEDIFEKMWFYTKTFQDKYWRKKRMKANLKRIFKSKS